MLKYSFVIFFLLFMLSCKQKEARKKYNSSFPVVLPTNNIYNYDSCKKSVLNVKFSLRKNWHQLKKSEKEAAFIKAVTGNIIPAWIGTKWSFYGVSEVPQKGSIACGYFVTTILRDAGLPLQRIKLAQCASEQMIRSLVQPKYISSYSNKNLSDFLKAMLAQGTGLYVVGLDNHTGFLWNKGSEIRFIHSTYIGTGKVQDENAASSYVLSASKYRVTGKISADEKLLSKWIQQP